MSSELYFSINKNKIGKNNRVYFIADIAANHDGSLDRAKKLIDLAKNSGADAVKFQHHNVKKYVNDYGFKNLGNKFSHQKKWKKSIYQVYKDAEVPTNWTEELKKTSDKVGVDFLSTPYDLDMVDHLDQYVDSFKIGSGDFAFNRMINKVISKKKPIFIACGASTTNEVDRTVKILKSGNAEFCLMQCNTNYTGEINNFDYINLNVLKSFEQKYKPILLGLSDHTPNDETVLGSIPYGVVAIEKHFTDDTTRDGPDHPFSMDPITWKKMVESTRLLERALGNGIKDVEKNEQETVILQRRSVRLIKNIKEGEILTEEHIEFQRPCPIDAIKPNDIEKYIGKKINRQISINEYLKKTDF